MRLFNLFKKKSEEIDDISKRYLSVGNKRYDENDILVMNDVYQVFKKYQGYEKVIDLSDCELVHDKVSCFIDELDDLEILCENYDEFDDLYSNYKEFPVDEIGELGIFECMIIITALRRSEYWFGAGSNIYFGYTKNELIPKLIYRVVSLYE